MDYSSKTIEMAQLIAETCTSCKRCMKDCLFLQQYCENPQEFRKRFGANRPFFMYVMWSMYGSLSITVKTR
jgi:Na+-translocating ferredoxin:NAD+ oxidoreductase RNF subunit RnfB